VIKILSISDQVDPLVYSDNLKERYGDVDFVLSCGDLSYMYLEYIITILNCPLYFVHGNHDPVKELNMGESRSYPFGAQNLHRKIVRKHGLLMAGVEGSIRYNWKTPYQYTQGMMWSHVLRLVPGLFYNKLFHGSDWTHQGIKAFRWLVNTFQPEYHFHGHIHYYHPDEVKESQVGKTKVINTYRSWVTEFITEDLSP